MPLQINGEHTDSFSMAQIAVGTHDSLKRVMLPCGTFPFIEAAMSPQLFTRDNHTLFNLTRASTLETTELTK